MKRTLRTSSCKSGKHTYNTKSLIELASVRFAPLSRKEAEILKAAQSAAVPSAQQATDSEDFPDSLTLSEADDVRADLLRWICIAQEARELVDPTGLIVFRANIVGRLNLESVQGKWPIQLKSCLIQEGLCLKYANFPYINLSGTRVSELVADNFVCAGSVILAKGFRSNGNVQLRGARIGCNLNCNGALLVNPRGLALDVIGATIAGSVTLCRDFRALGKVRFQGGTIGGNLECDGGRFAARSDFALHIESVKVERNVTLRREVDGKKKRRFRALGGVRLWGTSIAGNLDMGGAVLVARRRQALNAHGIKVGGAVVLRRGFLARGTVNLDASEIHADLIADGARLVHPRGMAFRLVSATVGGSVSLGYGFRSVGKVLIVGGTIGGTLQCDGGRFAARRDFALHVESVKIGRNLTLRREPNSKNGRRFRALGGVMLSGTAIAGRVEMVGVIVARRRNAVNATGIRVGGKVILQRDFFARGEVNFSDSEVHSNFSAGGAHFFNPRGVALNLTATIIGGSVFLGSGFRAIGRVRILGASIGGSLECDGGRFATARDYALQIERVKVGMNLTLRRELNSGRRFRALGGVRIFGSVVAGTLDMSEALTRGGRRNAVDGWGIKVGGSLNLRQHLAHGQMNFYGSEIASDVNAGNAKVYNGKGISLNFESSVIRGSLFLNGFRSEGTVKINNANVSKNLISDGRFLVQRGRVSILLDGSQIGGSLILYDAFHAHGQVRFFGGSVGGNIQCDGARLATWHDYALYLEGVRVKGSLFLRTKPDKKKQPKFYALGGIHLYGCSIDGNAELSGATLLARRRHALDAPGITILGYLHLNKGFSAHGHVNLYSSNVGSEFDASNGRFLNQNKPAISLTASRVKGNMRFNRAIVAGELSLALTQVGGFLSFSEARVSHQYRAALTAASVEAGSGVYLSYFRSAGLIDFSNAKVGGDFVCSGSHLSNWRETALSIAGAKISGNVQLTAVVDEFPLADLRCLGGVDATRTVIGGNLDCSGAILLNGQRTALTAASIEVKGKLSLGKGFTTNGEIDLSNATIGRLEDEEGSWPQSGKLKLDGLTYGAITLPSAEVRLRWLARQPNVQAAEKRHFVAQPYEQLAQTMRRHGHERDARKIAIAKQVELGKCGVLPAGVRTLHKLYGITMRYGYRPQFSLWLAPFFIVGLSAVLIGWGDMLMVPSKEKAREEWFRDDFVNTVPSGYPAFHPVAYAVDTFVPIINLQQKDNWQPEDTALCGGWPCGTWLRGYMWIHTICGWIITTLAVAGFTGLVRKD